MAIIVEPRLSLVGDIGEDYPVTEFIGGHAILRLIDGSRTTVDIDDNMVMETFKVFSDASPSVTQANVKIVQRRLSTAWQLNKNQSPHGMIRLAERLTDEFGARLSTIVSGSITPVDENTVSRTQYFGSAVYVVNIKRRRLWEKFSQSKRFDISVHGGSFALPERLTDGTQPGRIHTLAISGYKATDDSHISTDIDEFWVGIKSAPSNYDLSNFSPEIQVTYNIGNINGGFSSWQSGGGYIGGYGVQVNYGSGTDWARAFSTTLPKFNAVTTAGNNNAIYHGKYHLLIRYKTSADYSERYGLRAKFGWDMSPSAVTLEPVYLDPSPDAFKYVDLGVISIGGESFSYNTIGNTNLNSFGISIQSAVFDPRVIGSETKSILYFDSMSLVPAENYVYVKLPSSKNFIIGGPTAAEIYTREDDSSYGLVVNRSTGTPLGGGESIVVSRDVLDLIPIIDSADWTMPTDRSKIVFVASNDAGSLATATAKMDIGVRFRSIDL